MNYRVKYYAGSYSGFKSVNADDEDHAIAKVRAWVRGQMTAPMYSDSYQIYSSEEDFDYNEKEQEER